jgi:hypothetical protein
VTAPPPWLAGIIALGLGLAAPHAGAEEVVAAAPEATDVPPHVTVAVDCAELSREQAAEVEARARAEMITTGARVVAAELACDVGRVKVTVRDADRVSQLLAEATSAPDRSDRLVEAFTEALRQLQRLQLEAAADVELTVVPPARPSPPTAIPAPAGVTPSVEPLPAPRHVERGPRPVKARRLLEIGGGAALELWNGAAAVGPLLRAGYGADGLAFGGSLGALFPLAASPAFSARDVAGEVGADWQPSWSRGLRLHAGVGGSWLSANPTSPYQPRGATHLGTGLLVLALSRPIWLTRWAVLPELAVRWHTGDRRINLDDDARLLIGRVTPRLSLSLLHRFGR